MLRIGLVGCGHIGTVHAFALRQLADAGLVDARHHRDLRPRPEPGRSGWPSQPRRRPRRDARRAARRGRRRVDLHLDRRSPRRRSRPRSRADLAGVLREAARADARRTAGAIAELLEQVPHQVGLVLRYAPVFRNVAEASRRGRYGRPMALVLRDDQYFPIQGMYGSTWRSDVDKAGGGTLIEHSIHDVDVLQLDPRARPSRSARAPRRASGTRASRTRALAALAYAGGATAQLMSVWHQVHDPAVEPAARGVLRGGAPLDRGRLPRPAARRDLGRAETLIVGDPPAWIDRLHGPGGAGQAAGAVRRAEQGVPRCPGRGRGSGARRAFPGRRASPSPPTRSWTGRTGRPRSVARPHLLPTVAGGPALSGLVSTREDWLMPLSEEEQRILQEIEANLTATDPGLVQQVSETTLYRHAARAIKWAVLGFVAGWCCCSSRSPRSSSSAWSGSS